MKSEWRVLYNPMAGYTVYRIKRLDEPMHSGNIELPPDIGYMDGEKGEAYMTALAAKLNAGEAEDVEVTAVW